MDTNHAASTQIAYWNCAGGGGKTLMEFSSLYFIVAQFNTSWHAKPCNIQRHFDAFTYSTDRRCRYAL